MNWTHHRAGWNPVVNEIKRNFHNDQGIDFLTNGTVPIIIDNYNESYKNNWIAFLHITPTDIDLTKNILNNKKFHESLDRCHGIFTLSKTSKNFLENILLRKNFDIENLFYPMFQMPFQFNWNEFINNPVKKMYMIGHWRRNFNDFEKVKSNYKKVLIKCNDKLLYQSKEVDIIDYLDNEEYDCLFKNNIVFLSLEDASANTTILECINTNTPLIVNRLSAVEEYLGKSYPLFYKTLEEAETLMDINKIKLAHEYLSTMDKTHLNIKSFIKSLGNSKIYKKL